MRKKFWYVLFLPALLLCGCSNDDGEKLPSGGIELAEGTPVTQEIFADQTTTQGKGINFATSGPWRAVVEEVPVTKEAGQQPVDWVSLSQYSGEQAGNYTLTVSLSPNFTGVTRQAVIRIVCGDTEITISIVQKGELENGLIPRVVKTINYKEDFGRGASSYWGDPEEEATHYYYDEQGRVAKVVHENISGGIMLGETDIYTFDYDVVGEITITRENKAEEQVTKMLAKLDSMGRIVNLERVYAPSDDESNCSFLYNDAGQLVKVTYDSGIWDQFGYTDGLLNSITSWIGSDEESVDLPLQMLYPNRYSANTTNIDLNAVEWFGEDLSNLLYGMRLLGVGSSCLFEVSLIYDELSDAPYLPEGFDTPNQVIKREETKLKRPEDGYDSKVYTFDDKGYVSSFYSEQPYDIMCVTYDIVVGNELIDPTRPELGYKGEIQNYKEVKEDSDKNVYTYTVEYQK